MTKYIIIHCKHEGCYDFKCYQDEQGKNRITSIRINPPKIFLFNEKEAASEFYSEYINDIDKTDPRCRKGNEIEHIDYCSCGIIELDDDGNPVLFYNKIDQVFFLENTCSMFVPSIEIKTQINNMNLTNELIRKSKTLENEQKKQYIKLGKLCEDIMESDDESEDVKVEAIESDNDD
jgi:hypothetical protein